MSKPNKVNILDAFCIKGKSGEIQDETVFIVQFKKGQEPIKMLYEQVKYSYPEALIDFYERQFQDQAESEEEQLSQEVQELFDYDSHLISFGSKILEHINSFTLNKKYGRNSKSGNPTESERVFEQQAKNFHQNFIQKTDPIFCHIKSSIESIDEPKINSHQQKKESIIKSHKKPQNAINRRKK